MIPKIFKWIPVMGLFTEADNYDPMYVMVFLFYHVWVFFCLVVYVYSYFFDQRMFVNINGFVTNLIT